MCADATPDDGAGGRELPLRLSLLYFLLFPVGTGVVRPATLALAAAGLLHGGVLRSSFTWLALALLAAWRLVASWPLADNHAYLLVYWCLGVALSGASREPAASLARSGRLLIVLVFLFAVAWKLLLSDDYLDGTMFRVLLLGDERFEGLTRWVGGLHPADLEASRRFLVTGSALGSGARLVEPPSLRQLALALTLGGLLLEGLVALAFAAPLRGRWRWLRHAPLLLFCAGTYALAPVAGFGWLLLAMGLAQCPAGSRSLRAAYLAVFALLILEDARPWA